MWSQIIWIFRDQEKYPKNPKKNHFTWKNPFVLKWTYFDLLMFFSLFEQFEDNLKTSETKQWTERVKMQERNVGCLMYFFLNHYKKTRSDNESEKSKFRFDLMKSQRSVLSTDSWSIFRCWQKKAKSFLGFNSLDSDFSKKKNTALFPPFWVRGKSSYLCCVPFNHTASRFCDRNFDFHFSERSKSGRGSFRLLSESGFRSCVPSDR